MKILKIYFLYFVHIDSTLIIIIVWRGYIKTLSEVYRQNLSANFHLFLNILAIIQTQQL